MPSSEARRAPPLQPVEPAELPLLPGEQALATVLTRVVVSSAALTVLGSAACALLAWLGIWTPVVALSTLLVLAALAVRVSAVVPAKAMPTWSAALLLAVALATTAWTGLTSSEQVLPRRDSGSYLQSAVLLAEAHRTPLRVPAAAIGGPDVLHIDGVTLASPAFYQTGTAASPTVQPQFLIGPSAWYSVGWWLGGVRGALWVAALFGGLGVLALGMLTGYLVGPRWAVLGALGVALCFPFLHTARSTYSEPPAVLVLAAGLLVLARATRATRADEGSRRSATALGLLAGALVGGGALVRADALRETILLTPVAALLLLRRGVAGPWLLAGAGASTVVAAASGLGLAYRYLGDIAGSLVPLLLLGVVLAGGCGSVVVASRRGVGSAWWRRDRRLLPVAAPALVVATGLYLASRPLWQVVRQSATDPGSRVVAQLQSLQGLVVDGGRTYAEQSLQWTAWWTGTAAVALAFVAVAVGAQRLAAAVVSGAALPRWSGPLLVAFPSAVLTWVRPGITPDHPWADRRLVIPLALVVVCVVAAAAWLVRWSRARLPYPALVACSVAAVALLLLPEAAATWPHRFERVEHGELAAVETVCRAFRPGDVALMVDDRSTNEWPQVVRGMCGIPALSLTAPVRRDPVRRARSVALLHSRVDANGGRLVLLAADSGALFADPAVSGLPVTTSAKVVDVQLLEDARLLERRPDAVEPLPIRVWLAALR